VRLCGQSEPLSSQESVCPIAVTTGVFAVNRLRDPFGVEGLAVRITPTAAADDDRVDVRRAVEMVHAVRDGRRRLRPLDGCVLHHDVDGGVLLVDRVLDVVPGVSSEGRDDADPLRKRRRLLFLLVVEPATLFEFASQSLDGSRLVAVADDDHFHGLRSIFPPSTQ